MTSDTARPWSRLSGAAARVLGHPAMPWLAAAMAVVLSLPSLDAGFWLDDLHHRAALATGPVRATGYDLTPSAASLFAFTGTPDQVKTLITRGVFPWWTDKDVSVRFFRPLAGLAVKLDHRWWPEQPRTMHWHSLTWVFASVLAVGVVYRRWLPPAAAGLAALLFAVDEAHFMTFAWLAQRNHLIAFAFGMVSLLAHDTWRRRSSAAAAVVSILALLASLLSGEAGVATLSLTVVYALCLDRGSIAVRMASVLPGLATAAAVRAWAVAQGYGAQHSDSYVDPVRQPLAFVGALAERLPLLLLGQWTPLPPEVVLVAPSLEPWLVAAGLVVGGVLAAALVPLARREAAAAACGVGMLLAIVPACATFAHTRTLLFVGVGGMGLLALYLWSLPATLRASGRSSRRMHVALAAALVAIHVVLAPVVLARRVSLNEFRPWHLRMPADADLTDRAIVVLNGPAAFIAEHFPLERDADGLSVPRSVHAIGPSMAPLDVDRLDAHSLRLRSPIGWLTSPLDRLVRSQRRPVPVGMEVPLDIGWVTVDTVSSDGRPTSITLRLRLPLEDPSLAWMAFVDGAYRPWRPPAPGSGNHLPTPSLR